MLIRPLLPLWRAALAADHAPRTVRSYTDHVQDFLAQLGPDATIAAVTPQSIEAFKRRLAQRAAPKTVALALTAVRSFVRWQIACELRVDDPTLRVRFPKAPKPLPRALSNEQARELMAALVQPDGLTPDAAYQWRRNRLAIYLMLYAGLRVSEVRDLRWSAVQIEQRRLIVRSGKGDKDRVVPLHPVLVGELRLAASGRRESDAVCGKRNGAALAEKSLEHVFERWVPRELGLSWHFTPHQLRHTFITALIDHGANIFEAQELAGHESPETTRIYYRLSGEHLRGAVERLPAVW